MDTLIEYKSDAEREWDGARMPPFALKDLMSFQRLLVHFSCLEDREAFAKLISQKIHDSTRSLWYPPADIGHFAHKKWVTDPALGNVPREAVINPRHPVYIISKGRWKSRKTARALLKMKVPFNIVVEPQEEEAYRAVLGDKVLVLPAKLSGTGCSIPARNFVWRHSIKRGATRHWILDDNIEGFFRLTDNLKVPVSDGGVFRYAENFVERYTNVGIAGFNYFMFAPRKSGDIEPYTLNTRVYSCILIRNDMQVKECGVKLDLRWRGRYNEDTDLCLRALKGGWITVLFNAFLAFKATTMSGQGGNTENLYKINGEELNPSEVVYSGRKEMAMSLKAQHPDLVTVTRKWDRWQHHVDYSGFLQRLKPRPNLDQEKTDNNALSMRLVVDEKKRKMLDDAKKKKKLAA